MGLIKKINWINYFKNLPDGIPHKIKRQLFLRRTRKEQFESIYKAGGFGDSPSLSGVGSNLENTENVRAELLKLISKYQISTILDIPCGDMYWMRHVDLGSIKYVGADIVEELVKKNEMSFGGDNKSFKLMDIVEDDLPHVDLIMCRDCFIHLKYKDILKSLANIKKSASRYLLLSTYPQCTSNLELGEQFWRPLNMQINPFNLSAPLEMIHDGSLEGDKDIHDKCIALWRVKDLLF